MSATRDPWRWSEPLVLLAAALLAVAGARPFAGGWNDASRLAAAETLAERGTFAIDDSCFVRVPPATDGVPHPYPPDPPHLRLVGTLDKLQIGGRFYSDKPPVTSVLLAVLYRGWLELGGPRVADRPDLVIRYLTTATGGAAYLFAVWCVFRLGRRLGLTDGTLALFGASFTFATVALPYTRHVNGHILLLGAAAGVTAILAELDATGRLSCWKSAALGALAGFGYTCDLGAGPPLLAATGAFLLYRVRRVGPVVLYVAAALPWLAVHHVCNYAVGGTVGPANAVPAYLTWPGSPFTAETMTGGLKHSPGWFALYALDLLFGQKGIVSTNLPLWLAAGGAVRLLWWHPARRPAVLYCVGWTGCVWLLYAATSSNYGGQCASVRWFVPFVAPGFWLIGMTLAAEPKFRPDFVWLSAVGVPVAGLMWLDGPWMPRMVPGLWAWLGAAGAGWLYVRGNATWPGRATGRRPRRGTAISAPATPTAAPAGRPAGC